MSIKYLFFTSVFFYLVYFHYILILNIEIYKKLSQSLTKCSPSLINFYHISVVLVSLVLTLVYFFISDSEQVERSDQLIYLILLYYMTFISFIIWLCAFYMMHKRFWTNYKSLLSLVIASLIITISTFAETVIQALQTESESAKNYYTETQILLLSINGILQGLAILCNKAFRKTIRQLTTSRKETESVLQSSEVVESYSEEVKGINISLNAGLFSDLFDNITKTVSFRKTLIQIFVSLSLYFGKSPSEMTKKHCVFNADEISSLNTSANSLFSKSNKKSVKCPKLTLKHYKPKVFSNIKALLPSTSHSSIQSSLADPKNYSKLLNLACEEGGRSSSFVFLTSDEKFIIKTIKKQERKFFIKKILKVYSVRISSGRSRLARILGTFELVELKKNFIIMENILYIKDFSYIFDLKGSKVDRMVKGIPDPREPPTGVVLKDLNFDLLQYKLRLTVKENQQILKELTEDFIILKSMRIMDYSILLGICVESKPSVSMNSYSFINEDGYVISVGIIDFFQEYNFGKAGEKTVKSVFNKSDEISSVNPEEYFKRIIKMTNNIFK